MTGENDSVEIHLLRQWAAGEKPQWETMQLLTELEDSLIMRRPFLVKGTQIDGEHEHRVQTIVWAKDAVELNMFIEGKIFTYGSDGLDDEEAFFGYGDNMTGTKFDGSEEITEHEAEVLERLGVVYAWNNQSYTKHDCPKCGQHFSTCVCEEEKTDLVGIPALGAKTPLEENV